MTTRIKLRRDLAANWTQENPVLAAGEPGLETDTDKVKYGNGTTPWTDLEYASGGGAAGLTDEGNVVVTAGSTEHWIATQRREQFDTEPRSLRYDSLGNLYSLTKTSFQQDTIAVITKYTAAGAVAWQKSFTGAWPVALAVDSSNCAYITVEPDAPGVTVIKFSTAGEILWKKEYDVNAPSYNAFIEEKSATTMALAFSVATGGSEGSNAVVVMEISSTDGSVQIKKQLAFADEDQLVSPTGIDVDGDENVFVTGYYNDAADGNKKKMFIEKLDEDLDRVWSKSLETDSTYDMYGGDCASDAQGNIYVVGAYNVDSVNITGSTSGQTAGILTKLNSSGVVQWTRRIGPGPCGSFIAGLTATATGEIYLSAATFAITTQLTGGEEGVDANRMIVARIDTQGAAVWQRYVDVRNLFEEWDSEDSRGQAVAVFGDKFAVDGYGNTWNSTPNIFTSGTADREYDYFVTQLPTDGTALTIGNLDFTESRIPARFVTHTTTNSPLAITEYAETVLAENSALLADAESRIANSKISSETYDYVFGADGTLTIPNDGDIKLTQTQVGYLMAIGGGENNNDDINSRAVAIDTQGNMYVGGEEQDDYEPFITKISPDGVREWSVTIQEDTNGHEGRVNGIKIDPTTGNLVVVCEFYDNDTYSAVITLDQDTGHILSNVKYSDSDSDVYLNDIAYTSTGTRVLAGSKDGEFTEELPITPLVGSTTGTLYISRSEIAGSPSSWQIGGTGIDPFESIAYIERYTGLTGTTRTGSGAVFNIENYGNGSYGDGPSGVDIVNGGTNYLPGHKIKILGSVLGGADGTNDYTVIVSTILEGGVIETITGTGDAAGTAQIYSAVTGTNIDVGSGFQFTFEGPRSGANYALNWSQSITNGGTNYVANDIIVILGTSLGGLSPANDLTVNIGSVSNGAVQNFNGFSGTPQTTNWKLETNAQVDFADEEGAWSITYPLSRENLLITPTWTRIFGTDGDEEDRLYAVAVDSSDNIIAVGQGHGDVDGDDEDLAIVYKFSSTGTLLWTRKLNETDYDCYAKSVITIGTDIYVTHESNDDGDTVITKLDASGNIKWQRITNSGDDSSIARTADGNLLVTCEAYHEDIDDDALKVFLLSPSGEVVYKRWLLATTDDDTRFKNGRCLAVDSTSFYITAYFDANSYNSSIAARLPIDGSGTGEYGSFRYVDVNPEVEEFEGIDEDINYNINEVDLAGVSRFSGPLAQGEEVYVKSTTTFTTGTGQFFVNSFYPQLTVETVNDTDGGSIVFADGSKQSTSATDIPQRRYTGQRYTLGMEDRGHHILCTESNDSILVPYDARVAFPIGTVITIVNTDSSSVYIYKEGGSINMIIAGEGNHSGAELTGYGVATLLKVGREQWVIAGNVIPD